MPRCESGLNTIRLAPAYDLGGRARVLAPPSSAVGFPLFTQSARARRVVASACAKGAKPQTA